MKKIICVAAAAAVCSAAAFSGCSAGRENSNWLHYMNADAFVMITNGEKNSRAEEYNELCGRADKILSDLDKSLSVTNENSAVSRFNAAPAGAAVELDKPAYEVLQLAKSVYELTDGYYNPAVYYSVEAYGFAGGEKPDSADKLPDDGHIEAYKTLSESFGELELKVENGLYYAVKPQKTVTVDGRECALKIDLGGIGKGYAVDAVNALYDELGFKYGYFDFGGSSIAFKNFAEGERFELQIRSPRSVAGKSGYILSLEIENDCVSSSGDYEQFYEIEGVRYCHLINPMTGKPVQTGLMTATVIGGSAAEADALTTAIIAMGKERAQQFITGKLGGKKVVFSYTENGEYRFYANFSDFKLPDNGAFTAGGNVG